VRRREKKKKLNNGYLPDMVSLVRLRRKKKNELLCVTLNYEPDKILDDILYMHIALVNWMVKVGSLMLLV
jgi:hypothetical protein